MAIRRIGYACPICERNGITSHLYEAPPALATRCETHGEHVWTDSNQIREMQLTKLDLPRPVPQPVNRLPLTLQLPEQLLKNLQARYGDALNDSLIGVAQYAAQPQYLFLGSDDLERIQDAVGRPIAHGSELYGAIFEMKEQITELKGQVKQLTRASSIRALGTGVLLDLGDYLQNAVGKAAESNMSVEDFLSTYLKDSLANGWMMV